MYILGRKYKKENESQIFYWTFSFSGFFFLNLRNGKIFVHRVIKLGHRLIKCSVFTVSRNKIQKSNLSHLHARPGSKNQMKWMARIRRKSSWIRRAINEFNIYIINRRSSSSRERFIRTIVVCARTTVLRYTALHGGKSIFPQRNSPNASLVARAHYCTALRRLYYDVVTILPQRSELRGFRTIRGKHAKS